MTAKIKYKEFVGKWILNGVYWVNTRNERGGLGGETQRNRVKTRKKRSDSLTNKHVYIFLTLFSHDFFMFWFLLSRIHHFVSFFHCSVQIYSFIYRNLTGMERNENMLNIWIFYSVRVKIYYASQVTWVYFKLPTFDPSFRGTTQIHRCLMFFELFSNSQSFSHGMLQCLLLWRDYSPRWRLSSYCTVGSHQIQSSDLKRTLFHINETFHRVQCTQNILFLNLKKNINTMKSLGMIEKWPKILLILNF